MDKVFNKTVNALSRFGDQLERHLTADGHARSKSGMMFGAGGMMHHSPLERNVGSGLYSSRTRTLSFGSLKKFPGATLGTAAGFTAFNNFRPSAMRKVNNDRLDRPLFGGRSAATLNFGMQAKNDGFSGGFSGGFGDPMGGMGGMGGCCPPPVSIGCAPNYYVAERRQLELVPAPPPQIVPQPYPCPVPVDRPVPVPCPVQVPVPVPCDRPVPVPVPVPVPCDRPVPVPVPVCVPSPPPPPVCIPVPTPVPCYVPCCCPTPCCPPSCCPSPCCPPPCCAPPPCCPMPSCCPPVSPLIVNQSSAISQALGTSLSSLGGNPYGVL